MIPTGPPFQSLLEGHNHSATTSGTRVLQSIRTNGRNLNGQDEEFISFYYVFEIGFGTNGLKVRKRGFCVHVISFFSPDF